MALVDQAAMLAPGGRVRPVEVDASEFSGGIHRFHYAPFPIRRKKLMLPMEMNKARTQAYLLRWQYLRFWPFQVSGTELSTDRAAEPTLSVSNLDGHITALCLQFKDMVNAG